MKTRSLTHSLVAAALAAGGIAGVASNAHAGAYAFAYNKVQDFTILASDPANIIPNFATQTVNSGAEAKYGGDVGVINSAPAPGVDSPVANSQSNFPTYVQGENVLAPIGIVGGNYAWGDAVIENTFGPPLNGLDIRALNAAEVETQGPFARSSGQNGSGTFITVTINVTAPGTITFDFDANPYLQAFLSAGALAGSDATAEITANISITANQVAGMLPGDIIFDWSPDGLAGGITGGTETADPFSLNRTISQLPPGSGSLVYDPTGGADFGGGLSGSTAAYIAATNMLPVGTMTLSISMEEDASGQFVQAVIPEPSTVVLLGAGLIGMAAVTRRKLS